jgi:hypothetical protein
MIIDEVVQISCTVNYSLIISLEDCQERSSIRHNLDVGALFPWLGFASDGVEMLA